MHLQAHRITRTEQVSAQICIVGAGPAGCVLAQTLARAGKDVVLLEAGELKKAGRSQALYAGVSDDPAFHLPPDRDRTRGLGGTSAMWGGRCMPYDPIDFEPRAHVAHSGWPFGPEILAPWYRQAQTYVDCGPYAYESATSGLTGHLIDGFQSDVLQTETLERWSPPTHFGRSIGPELVAAPGVRVITGALVTGLIRDQEQITGVTVRAVKRKAVQFQVTADQVVLAGGGLETTRLLLASATDQGPALGDQSGWLGRGYMTHVGGVISRVQFAQNRPVIFGYEKDPQGIYVRRRLTLSAQAQKDHALLNMYALLDRPMLEDASHNSAILSLAWLAKRVLQRQSKSTGAETSTGGRGGKMALYVRHLRNLLFGAPEVLTVLPRFGRDRLLSGRRIPSLLTASGDNSYYLYFHAEQSPDRDNCIRLDPARKDAFGMPQLRIQARLSDSDAKAIVRAHEVIDAELRAASAGQLTFLSPEDPICALKECKATLGHHIGTTRMSVDPAQGVVDPDLRVHGCDNLYVASASALPSSSQAHPTLTLIALTLRLADHLAS